MYQISQFPENIKEIFLDDLRLLHMTSHANPKDHPPPETYYALIKARVNTIKVGMRDFGQRCALAIFFCCPPRLINSLTVYLNYDKENIFVTLLTLSAQIDKPRFRKDGQMDN